MSGSVSKYIQVNGFTDERPEGFRITARIDDIRLIADLGDYREVSCRGDNATFRTYESYETLVAALSQ